MRLSVERLLRDGRSGDAPGWEGRAADGAGALVGSERCSLPRGRNGGAEAAGVVAGETGAMRSGSLLCSALRPWARLWAVFLEAPAGATSRPHQAAKSFKTNRRRQSLSQSGWDPELRMSWLEASRSTPCLACNRGIIRLPYRVVVRSMERESTTTASAEWGQSLLIDHWPGWHPRVFEPPNTPPL